MATRTAGGNAAFHNFHNDYAHIADPNERRRLALAEVDKAPFGWYHVRAILVAGIGFFTDAYDIFAIGLVTNMIGIVYFANESSSTGGAIPSTADTAIKVATSGGTVIGQVGFGALADMVGRKRMYGLELILIIFATLAQALSADSPAITIVGIIIFWRVLMGIGIGGGTFDPNSSSGNITPQTSAYFLLLPDYPLSSIITSEFATTKWRGAMMGSVFAMQGIGQFAAGIMSLIVVSGFQGSLSSASSYRTCTGTCGLAVDKMWRIIIGFGAVPGCIALYYRLTIPETPRYTFDVSRDIVKGGSDIKAYLSNSPEGVPDEITRAQGMREAAPQLEIPKASLRDFFAHYSQWKYGKVLLGTAGSWFFLDVAFYGVSLNNTLILGSIGWGGGSNVYHILYNLSVGNLILVCAGAIPGYWVTVALCDTIGRKPIQLMGFTLLTIFFCIWGFGFNAIGNGGALGLFILCSFFFNFGPNSTTFIVPGECFPTRYRSTSHGLSAASGKVGSIIAQVLIGPLRTQGAVKGATGAAASPWLNHVLEIYALFMLCGIFTTLLIPETKRKTLEQLAGEVPVCLSQVCLPPELSTDSFVQGTPEYDPRLTAHAHNGRKTSDPSDEGAMGEKGQAV